MDTKKFKSKLDKISNVFESMQADNSISGLEKELLKKYVIQLYETLLDEGRSKSPGKKQKDESVNGTPKKAAPHVEPSIDIAVDAVEQPAEPKLVVQEPVQVVSDQPVMAQAPSTVASVGQQSSAGISNLLVNELEIPSSLKPVFEKVSTAELSDKLSYSKVNDISTAMGINEKIFTITELFGGDQNLFSTVTSTLNACTSYDDAVKYLSSTVARDQNWGQEDKLNKAKVFMKLVQRKFV